MWIMTTMGFYSIVEKPQGNICIRSRKREDLANLCKLFDWSVRLISRDVKADYRFRVNVSREAFEEQFPKLAKLVTYNNFKTAVAKVNPARETIYHRVWYDLLQIEHEGINKGQWFKNYLNEEE